VLSAHDTGLVTLQVAFNNQIISNSVVFEYKARALPTLPSSQHDWLSLDGKISVPVTLQGMEEQGHWCTRCETKEEAPRKRQGGILVSTKGGSAGPPHKAVSEDASVSLCLATG
jgi:hypothetical protein